MNPSVNKASDLFSAALRWAKVLLALWAVTIVTETAAQNPLQLPLLAALYFLFKRSEEVRDPRALSAPVRILGALFALMTVAATCGSFTASYDSHAFQAGITLISAAGLLLFWGAFLPFAAELVLRFYDSGRLFCPEADICSLREGHRISSFLLRFPASLCFLAWLPYFLYEYPGIISPDGIVQIGQILGTEPLSNHHPIAQTAVIALCMRIGSLFTDQAQHQIAFYTVAQMLFLALCCRAVLITLERLGVRRPYLCLTLAFFALTPYNGVFAVFVLKDVPFTGIAMLFTCALVSLIASPTWDAKGLLAFSLTGFAFCIFRSNGWFAFLACVPLFLIAFRHHASFKKLLPACAVPLLAAMLWRGPVLNAVGAVQPDFAESISIPLQQIHRVLVMDRALPDRDRAMIERVVDTTWIHEIYEPLYTDSVKSLVRAGDQEYLIQHKREYLLLWLRIGLRYPADYMTAFLIHTEGLWYPDEGIDPAMIDGVFPNDFGIAQEPLIGGRLVVKGKELLLKSGPLLPVLSFLWSTGFYFWALLLLLALTGADRKRLLHLVILLPFLMLYATLFIATPDGRAFRYIYPFVLCLPLSLTAPAEWPAETDHNPQTPGSPDGSP